MKYKLTDNKKEHCGKTLYQIQALRDRPTIGVKAGDLGGFIEKESNLDQNSDAQVSGEAQVSSKPDLVYLPAPKYDLTLTNAGLLIGCEYYSIEHWLSHHAEIGKKHGFTEKEIEHYFKLIKTVDKIYKAQQNLKE